MMRNKNSAVALGLAGATAAVALLLPRGRKANLAGQTVLITGGSRGLGFLLAQAFARQGCRIVICARGEAALEQAYRALKAIGAEVLALPCDVSDQAQVNELVRHATRAFGRIDIVVNNAGTIQVSPFLNTTVQDFEDAMGTMFWGMLYTTYAVLPQMLERRRGRIINITSIGGKASVPHLLPYGSAKFAATGLSEGLRAELAKEGITVTTIAPGLMRTGSYLNALFKGKQADEFTWFSIGGNLPVLSMSVERAVSQIMHAAQRGEAERVLSVPATLLARFHGLFPGVTADLLGLVANLLLPAALAGGSRTAEGRQVEAGLTGAREQILATLTSLGRSAVQRYQHEVR